VHIANGIGRK